MFKRLNPENVVLLLGLMLSVASCSEDPYLYDRTGFDASARPVVSPNPRAPNPVPPEYYPQQPQYYQPQPQYYAPQQVPAYIPNPAYSPYGQPSYQQYPSPGSRYYSNPYAIPPSNRYQRYDEDQYYVPPTYYNNGEPQGRTNSLSSADMSY